MYFKIATNISNICRILKRDNQSIPVIVNYYSCNAARFKLVAHLLTECVNCTRSRFPSRTTTGAGMGYLPWISQSSCRLCRSFRKEIGRPSSSFMMNSKIQCSLCTISHLPSSCINPVHEDIRITPDIDDQVHPHTGDSRAGQGVKPPVKKGKLPWCYNPRLQQHLR